MDKYVFLVLTFLSVTKIAVGESQNNNYGDAKIVKYSFTRELNGPYQFEYLTNDGQSRQENAVLTDENTKHESLFVTGSYSFTASDGKVYTVHYTADENGFHPVGDHINVPPYTPWPKGHHHDDDSGHSHHHNTIQHDGIAENINVKPIFVGDDAPTELRNDYVASTPIINVKVTENNAAHSERFISKDYIPSTPTPANSYYKTPTASTSLKSMYNSNTNSLQSTTLKPYTNQFVSSTNVQTLHPTYIPSTPSINIRGASDAIPYGSDKHLSSAYLPSTVTPKYEKLTGNHETASSSPVGVISKDSRGFARRSSRNKSSLFEVIQNNHSSGGVFDKNRVNNLLQ